MTKKCDECKYCYLQDTGYSNWTVEGCDIICLWDLNSAYPKDYWYGKADGTERAEACEKFTKGDPTRVDVDHDEGGLENYSTDDEVKALLWGYQSDNETVKKMVDEGVPLKDIKEFFDL